MKLISLTLLTLLLPSLVLSQINCHRCFGNSYCNDADHADFVGNVSNSTCPNPNTRNDLHLDSEDLLMTSIEKRIDSYIRERFGNAIPYNTSTVQHQCVTATVYEGNDAHTLRTCISSSVNSTQSSPSICELIRDVIAPANNHNGTFSCRACNNHFCNTHTLSRQDGLGGSATIATINVFLFVALTLLTTV